MRSGRLLSVVGLVMVAIVSGCASVVDGKGSAGSAGPGASISPDFPTASPSAAPSASSGVATTVTVPPSPSTSASSSAAAGAHCPVVSDPTTRLSFPCITSGMTSGSSSLWPVQVVKQVESTGWVLEEGVARFGRLSGTTLTGIANVYLNRMVIGEAYLPDPTVTTIASRDTLVGGAPAHVLQTMITLDKTQAAKRGTQVRQEQLTIVAIQVGADDVSVWHVSVPDLVKTLWPKVPGVVAGIKVG